MAIRNIVKEGDVILSKTSRKIENFDQKLWQLLDDMDETMRKANGVGLAAVQVGMLKRCVIVDIGDEEGLIELINPVIVEKSGSQNEVEGCLSCPGEYGITERPMSIRVKAQDRNGNSMDLEVSGFKAVAFCHEIDHLDGILFKEKAIRMLDPSELDN